jgi:hypothetical protein
LNDGEPGWGRKVWLKGSNQDDPADRECKVIDGMFDGKVDQSEKEAVPALIEQWEEKSPLMVAALSKPGVHEANAKSDSQPQ